MGRIGSDIWEKWVECEKTHLRVAQRQRERAEWWRGGSRLGDDADDFERYGRRRRRAQLECALADGRVRECDSTHVLAEEKR